jgi:hypothetical protein
VGRTNGAFGMDTLYWSLSAASEPPVVIVNRVIRGPGGCAKARPRSSGRRLGSVVGSLMRSIALHSQAESSDSYTSPLILLQTTTWLQHLTPTFHLLITYVCALREKDNRITEAI